MFLPSYFLIKTLLFLDTLPLVTLARCLFTMPINSGDFPIFETAIPVATIDAYLATDYQVNTVERFVLNVGRPSPELARWFQTHKENQVREMLMANAPSAGLLVISITIRVVMYMDVSNHVDEVVVIRSCTAELISDVRNWIYPQRYRRLSTIHIAAQILPCLRMPMVKNATS